MSQPIINIRNLGKRYRLGTAGSLDTTFGEMLCQSFQRITRRTTRRRPDPTSDLWALRHIDLAVQPGEVVGVIGRNGSGKSTLLKVLSRITSPTEGHAEIRGRLSSLLEVGTGFHPELTGRENIYLNGSILGMRKREIDRKFDQIVAFSGVEPFLATPVKRYSSGMYVRLAFAVAAHLDPEILLIDEVLAVGDIAFQRKCLGKMRSVAQSGRTVLFVSHNMGTVDQLCDRAILLDHGRLIARGSTGPVIAEYMKLFADGQDNPYHRPVDPAADTPLFITDAATVDSHNHPTTHIAQNKSFALQFRCRINQLPTGALLDVILKDRIGRFIFTSKTELAHDRDRLGRQGFIGRLELPAGFLTRGRYFFQLRLHIPRTRVFDDLPEICAFEITDTNTEVGLYGGEDFGCVCPPQPLKIEPLDSLDQPLRKSA